MLKETIDKTRELTNNVKIAKNEINDAIVRGGGVRSKDLKGIPQNIRNMVNQYSKVAIGTIDTKMPVNRGQSSTYIIRTKTNFVIKKAIVFLQHLNKTYPPIGLKLEDYLTSGGVYFDIYYRRIVSLKLQNKNEIVIKVEAEDYSIIDHFYISSWIAIG